MTITRGARAGDKVVTILRESMQDERLSYRARGILAAALSRPPDWRTDYRRLASEGREGERAVLAALAELEEHGYLRRERVHNGRHIVTTWEISDRPELRPASTGGRRRGRGQRFLQPTNLQPTKQQPTKQQPTELQGVLDRETERETPPPTPSPSHERLERVRALVVVVEEGIGETKPPARGVLLAEAARLLDDGWTPEQLAAAVRAHDWTGARAGAVVAYLRGLTSADQGAAAAQKRARKRPDWCGRCEETSRMIENTETGVPSRCPDCHPRARTAS